MILWVNHLIILSESPYYNIMGESPFHNIMGTFVCNYCSQRTYFIPVMATFIKQSPLGTIIT